MSEETAKKLAMEVRQSKESEQFDLAGYGPNSVAKMVQDAFTNPLPLDSMVRLSFVVGGGKKVRQKYNDGLPNLLADALRGVSFVEDRGASTSLDSAGTFKYQHDTDKDVKVVHVFPRLDTAAAAATAASGSDAEAPAMTPAQLLTFAEQPTFERMIAAKCPTFGQRRRALDALKATKAEHASIEAKLSAMQALTPEEQTLYDDLDVDALDAKCKWLQAQMEQMVAKGQLQPAERDEVVAKLNAKLEEISAQWAQAEADGKAKRAEKLQELHADVKGRLEAVRQVKAVTRKPKFEAEIKAAKKKLAELVKLENTKGVLPLEEVQKLNAKPKLLDDLRRMEAESAGWFS